MRAHAPAKTNALQQVNAALTQLVELVENALAVHPLAKSLVLNVAVGNVGVAVLCDKLLEFAEALFPQGVLADTADVVVALG